MIPFVRLVRSRPAVLTLLFFQGALLSGCAGYQAYREGETELSEGRVESGIAKLKQAVDESPSNQDFRREYFTRQEAASNNLLRTALTSANAGDFNGARQALNQLSRVDPANPRGPQTSDRIDAMERQWKALDIAQDLARKADLDGAITKTQEVLSENPGNTRAMVLLKQLMRQQADRTGRELGIYPKLKAAYRTPVSLSFSNATLQQAFDALKQASGLNYVLDKDVRTDSRVMLSVTNKPVQDVLRLLLATNQLEQRVLDEDTLLIYPNTPSKAAEYREMVVRTFYLANAEAGKMAAMIKAITKAKDVMIDEKLNLVIVRDSEEVVRLAEKLIAAEDLPEPEVMLDLEVMEVSVNRLLEMGVDWPTSVAASVHGTSGIPGQLTPSEARHFNSGLVTLNIGDPAVAARLRSQVGSANLLANPRVRVRNKQSAKILIGERVPVFTTTATANVGTSESVNYLDVGLKLDIEPTISLNDDVSMKMALEVSNIIQTITRASGTQAYRLGTRNTSTTLQVHDGETNVLAGLIQKEDRRSNSGVPLLNEVPLLSKLFGADQDNDSRTEIVLLVTPHIIRNVEPPGVGLQEFTSGTDTSIGAPPIQLGTPLQVPPGAMPNAPGSFFPGGRPNVPFAPAAPSPSAPGNGQPADAARPPSPPPSFTPPPLIPVSPGAPSGGGGTVR